MTFLGSGFPNKRENTMTNYNVPSVQATPQPMADMVKGELVDAAGRAIGSMAQDISQGNRPGVEKAVGAAIGKNTTKVIKETVKGMKGNKSSKSTKGGFGKKGNKRGRSTNNGLPPSSGNGSGTTSSQFSTYSPFSLTPAAPKIELPSAKDGSLYKLPYASQDKIIDIVADVSSDTSVFLRTAVRLFTRNVFDFGSNQLMKDASYRIFGEIKFQVNSNTNGGNAQTKSVLTYAKFWNYVTIVTQSLMILSEIEARSTWNPGYDESNLILRDIKNLVTGDIQLLTARNRLRDQMASLALPKKLMDYYTRLFYVFKKSPVSGGVHQLYMSAPFAADISAVSEETQTGFDLTVTDINDLVDQLRADIDENAVLTAFLVDKCDFSYISQRYRNGSIDYPCYDAEMNATFDNLPKFVGDLEAYGHRNMNNEEANSLEVALPMNPEEVTVHTVSHFLPGWYDPAAVSSLDTSGFPFFGENKGTIVYPNAPEVSTQSNIIFKSEPNFGGFVISRARSVDSQITDHICTIAQYSTPTDVFTMPRGMNVRRYQPSFESCSNACVR